MLKIKVSKWRNERLSADQIIQRSQRKVFKGSLYVVKEVFTHYFEVLISDCMYVQLSKQSGMVETDQMGYLYYGNYALLYEIGRSEAIGSLGLSYRKWKPTENHDAGYFRRIQVSGSLSMMI